MFDDARKVYNLTTPLVSVDSVDLARKVFRFP